MTSYYFINYSSKYRFLVGWVGSDLKHQKTLNGGNVQGGFVCLSQAKSILEIYSIDLKFKLN